MLIYVIRRLLAALPTLLAVLTLVFLIVRVVPGDPAMAILGDQATPASVAAPTSNGLPPMVRALMT